MKDGDYMVINIRGERVEITESIRNQIENKFKKLEKYFDNPDTLTAHINIKVYNLSKKIEATIPTSKFTIRAEESHEDLYAAIDLVIDKMERQIRKNKTKLKNKYKNIPKIDFNFDNFEEEKIEENKIVKRKEWEMKPMDEEEALIQMELLGHDFFVFKNMKEECISVVYKRKAGNFGIINVK